MKKWKSLGPLGDKVDISIIVYRSTNKLHLALPRMSSATVPRYLLMIRCERAFSLGGGYIVGMRGRAHWSSGLDSVRRRVGRGKLARGLNIMTYTSMFHFRTAADPTLCRRCY